MEQDKKLVVILSGGFDPLHEGHVSMLRAAREMGGEVCVLLNSDQWLTDKKGINLMPVEARRAVLEMSKYVDHVIEMTGNDKSAIEGLGKAVHYYGDDCKLVFANGGDRNSDNIPELDFCNAHGIDIIDGVGGDDKPNSSSWMLDRFGSFIVDKYIGDVKQPRTLRRWGSFEELLDLEHCKVKRLILLPGKSISKQFHHHRNETWVVVKGAGLIQIGDEEKLLTKGNSISIPAGEVHKLTNSGKINLELVEVQDGDYFGEDDIVRLEEVTEL